MYNDPSFADEWTPQQKTFLEIFLHLFPLEFFTNMIVEGTSNALVGVNSVPMTIGEMLRYIRMWLLMSCNMKSQDYFWQSAPRTKMTPHDDNKDEENNNLLFTFNRYMSWRRVAITSALRFTLSNLPTFWDKFWEARDMITTFNKHMAKIFLVAWVVCLDESMSICWHNRWTCPGWVFCPCKPHPFGNEYHTSCCRLSGILFSMELVEGKDHPPQIQERWSQLGRMTGLLMRMLLT